MKEAGPDPTWIWAGLCAGAGGTEYAKTWGAWPDGDFREPLAEVQGEERLRFASQVLRAVSALLSSLGFILEAVGSLYKF